MKSASELYNSLAVTATPEEFLSGHGNWSMNSNDCAKAKRLAKSIVDGDMTPYVGKNYEHKLHDRNFVFAEWMEGRIKCQVIGFIYSRTGTKPKAKKIEGFSLGIKVVIWPSRPSLDSVTIDYEMTSGKLDDDYIQNLFSKRMKEWFLPEGFDISACLEEFRAHLMEAGRYE